MIRNKLNDLFYGNRLTAILRIIMGALFVYSAFYKVLEPNAFVRVIIRYNIIPEMVTPYVAIILPFIELILGFLLLIGLRVRASSLTLIFLMILFIFAITLNVIRGESFDCGCFEFTRFGFKETIGISIIIRDVIILLILLLLFNVKRHYLSLDSIIERENLSYID